jgi:hypothetical protein
MKALCLCCAILCWSAGLCADQTTFLPGQDYWNNPSAWDNGVPIVTKDAIIPNDLWCIVDSNAIAKSLTCEGRCSIYSDSYLTLVEASSVNECYLDGTMIMSTLSVNGFLDVEEGSLFGDWLVNHGDVSFSDPFNMTCAIENHSVLGLGGTSISLSEITGDGAIVCQCEATVSSITGSSLAIGDSGSLVPEPSMAFYGINILLLVFVMKMISFIHEFTPWPPVF